MLAWSFYFLQAVGEELVHLGDAGGDAEVDGAVADFDDKAADDVRVDLLIDWIVRILCVREIAKNDDAT